MPRLFKVRSSTTDVTAAYCVDSPVGFGCPNNRDDVLLVQHLLRIAWNDAPTSKGFRPPGETQPLSVDGLWGTQSSRFLKFFQEEAKRRGANVLLDQRVDPCSSGSTAGTISHTFYTGLALNSARNSRQQGNQADISKDPGYPVALDKYFYVNWQ
jgi:hypothetical protein